MTTLLPELKILLSALAMDSALNLAYANWYATFQWKSLVDALINYYICFPASGKNSGWPNLSLPKSPINI
jgi:hypothetical protein